MSDREQFLEDLKTRGLIVDYKMEGDGSAVVHVRRPISYMRIEVVQLKCECGCCDSPDHGACEGYEQGGNGRCAYCDHAEGCHPQRKAEEGDAHE